MIVVDASAAIAALLNAGPARHAMADEPIHVPHLIDVEVASGLRRLGATGRIDPAQAWTALDTFRRLGVTRHPLFPFLERVWELRDNLSCYDASYLALAETLGCPVLTADTRLTRAPGVRCPVTVIPR